MSTVQASPRLALKNVLVPTDFSDTSEKALAYARAFAEDYGAKIYVSHAVNPTPPIFMPMEPIPIDLDAEWQDAQAQLNRFVDDNLIESTRPTKPFWAEERPGTSSMTSSGPALD